MINFDNIYLVILYFIFGLPGAIIRFTYLNIITMFKINGNVNFKKLWSKDEIMEIFLHPYNLLIGLLLFIAILIIS
jgi:hypothetical protein